MKLVAWEALPEIRRAALIEFTERVVRPRHIDHDIPRLARDTYQTAVLMFVVNDDHHVWPGGSYTPTFAAAYVDGLFDALVNLATLTVANEPRP